MERFDPEVLAATRALFEGRLDLSLPRARTIPAHGTALSTLSEQLLLTYLIRRAIDIFLGRYLKEKSGGRTVTRENNELICRVSAQTPMGKALRRYWLPVHATSDIPGARMRPSSL